MSASASEPFQMQTLPPMHFVSVRHIGPYHEIGASFERFMEWGGPAGILGSENAEFCGMYLDDPGSVPPQELKSDAGVAYVGEFEIKPEDAERYGLQQSTLPGGRYAVYRHIGPYSTMGDGWMRFMEAISGSGIECGAVPPFELYKNDMETTPEAELITDLHMSVAE